MVPTLILSYVSGKNDTVTKLYDQMALLSAGILVRPPPPTLQFGAHRKSLRPRRPVARGSAFSSSRGTPSRVSRFSCSWLLGAMRLKGAFVSCEMYICVYVHIYIYIFIFMVPPPSYLPFLGEVKEVFRVQG